MPPKTTGSTTNRHPTRARNPTAKAKAANLKDASPESDHKKAKKRAAKGKARKKKAPELSESSDEGLIPERQVNVGSSDVEEDKIEVDWKDVNLNWSLITVLEEDSVIRQGLFPLPGGNATVSQGGSKPKTEYQWMLARRLFEGHEKYGAMFAQVKTSADKTAWLLKIKNQLKRMTQDVRKYRDEMGETGAGIVHEEAIDMDLDNALTRSWAEIQKRCPWFFRLKAIIDECPSLVPTGIGNNSSGYDVSLLGNVGNTSELDTSDGLGIDIDPAADLDEPEEGDPNGELPSGDSDAGEDKSLGMELLAKGPGKRKAEVVDDRKGRKTSARSGQSAPATSMAKKAKTATEKINSISLKEEETTQRMLDVKKLKAKGESDKVLARIKAKSELKLQEMKIRGELAQKKLDNEFKLQMARLGHLQSEAGPSSARGSVFSFGSGFSDMSATPSAYSNDAQELEPFGGYRLPPPDVE